MNRKIYFSSLVILLATISLVACKRFSMRKTLGGVTYTILNEGRSKDTLLCKPGYFALMHIKVTSRFKEKDSVKFNSREFDAPQIVPLDSPKLKSLNPLEAVLNRPVGTKIESIVYYKDVYKQDPNARKEVDKRLVADVYEFEVLEIFSTLDAAKAKQTELIPKYQEAQAKMNEKAAKEQELKDLEQEKKDAPLLAQSKQAFDAYIAKNNFGAGKINEDLYVVITKPGNGQKVNAGNFVQLMYTGKTLNDSIFDSNRKGVGRGDGRTLDFVIDAPGMIKGFNDGVKQLSKGASAKIIMNGRIAYGARGAEKGFKPYEPMVFDVDVVNVQNEAPKPVAPTEQAPKVEQQVQPETKKPARKVEVKKANK
jgi:FKBP-type peptidyl-prolyl cis-trans isomerase FkpA